jgi:Dna[CI] antecedent DciA-like protein
MTRAAARDVAEQLFGATPERRLVLLRAAWPQAVGPELARRTEVIALEGNALRVRVPDAGWRKGLVRMKHEILGRLRAIAGGLAPSALGFVEARPAAVPAPAEPSPPAVRVPAPPTPDLLAQAARIEDPELRDRFLASAARYLDRFRPAPAGKSHA